MRIDLERSPHRTWTAKLMLAVMNRLIGVKPGPVLSMTYRPDLVDKRLHGYFDRGVAYSGPWTKGESELFAAFVSHLNACQF